MRTVASYHEAFGEAGHRASHSRCFWGTCLCLVTTVEGMPIMWCLANPNSTNAKS